MSKRMHRLTLHDTSHLCRKNCIARVQYPLFDKVFTKRRLNSVMFVRIQIEIIQHHFSISHQEYIITHLFEAASLAT